ncbi:hypothetical protein ACQEU8_21650 [Streptomyces sp. CA-250714]|uniref:hypothetical protein n=1 Tax=Streptomyces sp. CA-250714 TaxID=3240060 RepID=UPI003D8F65CC
MVAWIVFVVLLILVLTLIYRWTASPPSLNPRNAARGGSGGGNTAHAWSAGEHMNPSDTDSESSGSGGEGSGSGGEGGASCGGGGGGGASCGGGGGGGGF